MKLVPVAFKAQKRDGNLVWGGEWLSAGWRSSLSLLDSGSFLPGTWTQVRPASQRLPCSSLSAFPKVMAGEGRGTVEVRQ